MPRRTVADRSDQAPLETLEGGEPVESEARVRANHRPTVGEVASLRAQLEFARSQIAEAWTQATARDAAAEAEILRLRSDNARLQGRVEGIQEAAAAVAREARHLADENSVMRSERIRLVPVEPINDEIETTIGSFPIERHALGGRQVVIARTLGRDAALRDHLSEAFRRLGTEGLLILTTEPVPGTIRVFDVMPAEPIEPPSPRIALAVQVPRGNVMPHAESPTAEPDHPERSIVDAIAMEASTLAETLAALDRGED